MKKHYVTHVEDTDKLISVAGPILEYKSWYEQYRKLMEEQAQRKYGLYTPTSEGDEDDFPSISGMIARYSASGLTNEQMAANPVWKDLTGNGYDLQMKNFGWAGMSGVNGYDQNFNLWGYGNLHNATETHTSNKIELNVIDAGNRTGNIYSTLFPVGHICDFNIKVTGLKDPCFILVSKGTTESIIKITNDGIYNIKATVDESWNQRRIYFIINNSGGSSFDGLVIEQLPLYPGFILGDGVDDEAVTKNNLDLEDTYTVYTPLILLKYGGVVCGKSSAKDYSLNTVISSKSIGFDSANAWSGSIPVDLYKFVLVVCKRNSKTMYIKDLITGKSNQSNSKEFVSNPGKYFIWRNIGGSWSQVAIAGQVICNGYFSTDEDDEKVLNYYKQEYPWLFPDQAWTVVGKTNEDEDRATIANITGNGNNLVLSNSGFAEGSGYNEQGEYAGYLVTDGVDDKITSSTFEMGNDWTVIGDWELINTGKNDNAGIVKFDSIVIYNYNPILINIKNGRNNLIPDQNTVNAICSDGRIYSKDWKESIYNEETESTSKNLLTIGYSGNSYTKIAFKNLAIYPTVLSKEDCIKAYNYLQTLKSK